MIKVYFESSRDGETSDGSYAELVAVVATEEIYSAIFPMLEELAKQDRMIVTESVYEDVDMEVIP